MGISGGLKYLFFNVPNLFLIYNFSIEVYFGGLEKLIVTSPDAVASKILFSMYSQVYFYYSVSIYSDIFPLTGTFSRI